MLVKDKLLQNLSGGYVDDLIRAGNGECKRLAKNSSHKFEKTEDQDLPCVFIVFSVKRQKDGTSSQVKHDNLRRLENISSDYFFRSFRSIQMRLA